MSWGFTSVPIIMKDLSSTWMKNHFNFLVRPGNVFHPNLCGCIRIPKLPKPVYCQKIDSEYVCCGTASIFMLTEPLGGWWHAVVLSHHTKGDYAKLMRQVAEKYYPDCKKIILVSDNLSTHSKATFYEAFVAQTAYWLSQKYEMHYTPKHGSWLNIAETELSSLSIQCLRNKTNWYIGGTESYNIPMGNVEELKTNRSKLVIYNGRCQS